MLAMRPWLDGVIIFDESWTIEERAKYSLYVTNEHTGEPHGWVVAYFHEAAMLRRAVPSWKHDLHGVWEDIGEREPVCRIWLSPLEGVRTDETPNN